MHVTVDNTTVLKLTFAAVKGHDPTNNARLATAIEKAKKGSVPKAVIQAAIARGQGKSTTGAKLEPVTLEAIVPPSVGIVVECETDNRARTLGELRLIVKNNEGNVTPTAYMFEKKGRIVLRAGGKALTADEVLESALESGALDTYEEGDGRHVVLTEPSSTFAISQSLAASLDAEIEASDIIWKPNEDTTALVGSDKDALALTEVLASIQEQPDVLAVYANIAKGAVSEPNWAELQSRISL